ncbi:hypothetical protein M409DRAFT_65422 [Zasmidium cellare ATCC 36951]|uniref:AB hydrolase-1 domain-containing protein n=1 Tax=Zasmidium cellare ATCC 36951 TaxID=1080233 RepID=A0A6A6CSJ0_ZASCE|nr:uncharacterized protein M409DRAFT_65422 [Zasmidium cellare ATCC 36951]KAF2168436.1 hypothetical protein M409DRAFT_65422 [Zasmidium cellare ATCC 36951]
MGWKHIVAAANCLSLAAAHPSPVIERRDFIGSVVSGLGADATNVAKVASAFLDGVEATVPTATISTFPQATSALTNVFTKGRNFLDTIPSLIEAGFDPNDIPSIIEGYSPADNSINNIDPPPNKKIYPESSPSDPAYSLPESTLLGSIHIPNTFTYGTKPPVILFPGTGVPGGITFAYTYARLLAKLPYADPLWLNIPDSSLNDAQLTAEHAAYAINYIASLTSHNVTIITFSQGSLNLQWALTFFPSTRPLTNQLIALSPDYHGTVNAALICPTFPNLGCTPSVLQQFPSSNFISTLFAHGGASAYIPTTSIRSATDQIVQPQTGPNPSGVLQDERNVGVTNYLVQEVCPASPAGTLVTHEGILYNSIAYALTLDALQHGRPAQLSRVEDLGKICAEIVAEGMSLADLVATEGSFAVFFGNFLAYTPRTSVEPKVMGYAV